MWRGGILKADQTCLCNRYIFPENNVWIIAAELDTFLNLGQIKFLCFVKECIFDSSFLTYGP